MQQWNILKGFVKELCGTILDVRPKKSVVSSVDKTITTERK